MHLRFGFLITWAVGAWLVGRQPAMAQSQCADRLPFTPVSGPNLIEWNKFPDFSLPFPVIYGGPRFADAQASPLRHGFSHLTDIKDSEYGSLVSVRQRALVYYGFATGLNQPWETIESPWGNDLTAYRAKWDQFLAEVSGGQKNAAGQYVLQVDRLALDIERIAETDAQILRLKQNAAVPAIYRQLPDAEFIQAYKRAIRNLYAEGMRYVRQRADLTGVSVSSYADTPVLNTYLNVPGNSWADWTTNLSRVNYLVKDSTERRIGGPYYEQLDALSPSAYYYYDYPNPLAPDYLAYLLFQVEVQRAWSSKPVVPWVWLRYHNTSRSYPNFLQPFMAEATAIFPFFSGAAGLWLWEEPSLDQKRTDNYAAYEHFTHGLYRLSRFADMFRGQYELVIETPARDLMDRKLPVWRGVVKANNILIAAQHPYAAEGAKTSLTVRYKSWQQTIELTGREVYLCRFDMGVVTATEPVFAGVAVFPNPVSSDLIISFSRSYNRPVDVRLYDLTGRLCHQQYITDQSATGQHKIHVDRLSPGLYVVQLDDGNTRLTKRVLITD